MPDSDTYIKQLEESSPLREPVIRSAIQSLQLPKGSKGLDAGCGIGTLTKLLSGYVGTMGHVTGLDVSSDFIEYASKKYENDSLSHMMSFQQGDIAHLHRKTKYLVR